MKRSILLAELIAMPWALMPERLSASAGVLVRWARNEPRSMDDEDFGPQKSAWEIRRERAQAMAGSGSSIAVLPLYGTIMQRANMMTEWCGGTSTQQFAQSFRDAMADPSVGPILIDVDSPGGSVYGIQELASEIMQARGQKQIVAISNSLAASAAYWLGCAASEFYVTPGGEVGSIGVWQAHEDYSKALDEAGVKTTLISAGKFKVEGNPYQPLDGDAQAFMQSRVDDYYQAFTKAVAKGRGVPIDQVRNGMGQGRVLGADAALAEKMVDGVMTFDDVVKKMQRDAKNASKSGASKLAQAKRELDMLS